MGFAVSSFEICRRDWVGSKTFIDALLDFSDCFCFFLRSCVWNLDLMFCFCDASVSYGNDFDRNALVS